MQTVDAAASHPCAFVFMLVLMLVFGVGRVAKETKTSVKNWKSFFHLWMFAYLLLLGALMSVTTDIALVLLVKPDGLPNVTFVSPSLISLTSAVAGVFGFEFLFRKLIVGFGENKLDLDSTLQTLVDQAVEATLKKEAGG
jgi:hypothetical protein